MYLYSIWWMEGISHIQRPYIDDVEETIFRVEERLCTAVDIEISSC